LEAIVSPIANKKEITFVGFGFLVRNRRLAGAILQLGESHAYEGRMLLRSMIEIHINYSWIRLSSPKRRANRFLKFQSLEELMILKDVHTYMNPEEYQKGIYNHKSERAKVRHLFRNYNKNRRLQWDRTWASVNSVKDRLKEILDSKTGNSDGFIYTLYRWASSAIHGGPLSVDEVLETNGQLRAKFQPEANPLAQIAAAFMILFCTIKALAEDTGMLNSIEPELSKLERGLNIFNS